jgi:hypothetical protein
MEVHGNHLKDSRLSETDPLRPDLAILHTETRISVHSQVTSYRIAQHCVRAYQLHRCSPLRSCASRGIRRRLAVVVVEESATERGSTLPRATLRPSRNPELACPERGSPEPVEGSKGRRASGDALNGTQRLCTDAGRTSEVNALRPRTTREGIAGRR